MKSFVWNHNRKEFNMAQNFIKDHCNDPNYFKDIALKYASNIYSSMDKTAKYFGISVDNVKSAIKYAIIWYLISYADCLVIKRKSDNNQKAHYIYGKQYSPYPQKPSSASIYYDQLFELRIKNIVENYTDKQILHVFRVYLRNPNEKNVWDKLGLSKKEMNAVLKKGIIFGVISDKGFEKLRETGISKARSQREADIFNSTMDRLASFRKNRKKFLKNIESYKKQLSKCDDNLSASTSASSDSSSQTKTQTKKEELEQKLKYEENLLAWFDSTMIETILGKKQ